MKLRIRRYATPMLIGVALVALILLSQVERLVTKGTLFGYAVMHKQQNLITTDTVKSSAVCSKITEEVTSKVLGAEVHRVGSNIGDQNKPEQISTCLYRTKTTPYRSVTAIVRSIDNEAIAKKQVSVFSSREGAEPLESLGDQAYYMEKQQQTVLRNVSRIITVTVSPPTQASAISSKDASTELAKKLL